MAKRYSKWMRRCIVIWNEQNTEKEKSSQSLGFETQMETDIKLHNKYRQIRCRSDLYFENLVVVVSLEPGRIGSCIDIK